MSRNKASQITFNVKDDQTRQALNDFAKRAGFNSAGDLARHLLSKESGIDCVPQWGGKREVHGKRELR